MLSVLIVFCHHLLVFWWCEFCRLVNLNIIYARRHVVVKKKPGVLIFTMLWFWPATATLIGWVPWILRVGHLWISGAICLLNYAWVAPSYWPVLHRLRLCEPTGLLGWWAWLINMQWCVKKKNVLGGAAACCRSICHFF